jgi:ADP-ribosylglycohydrolase
MPIGRAVRALEGLSVGDAFGQRFFGPPELVEPEIESRTVPEAPWEWTDDTAMALSVFEHIRDQGVVDRDRLAGMFGRRYAEDPRRGYGAIAQSILTAITSGTHWRKAAGAVFEGQGSRGNGAAMRVAPLGAYFADDLDAVVRHARASAEPTHRHPDGIAGAVAVAVATAVAWRTRGEVPEIRAAAIFSEALKHTENGPTRTGIARAAALRLDFDVRTAVSALGNGAGVISSDTVPFSLWCAARHITDYEEALWATVSGLGDRDTTCAIVGGIVAAGGAEIPQAWIEAREPLNLV